MTALTSEQLLMGAGLVVAILLSETHLVRYLAVDEEPKRRKPVIGPGPKPR